MVVDQIQEATAIVTSLTGVGTLVFMVTSFFILRRAAVRVDEMHVKQDELIEHTNGMASALLAKTDIAARAEGVKEGVAQQLAVAVDANAALLVSTASETAAKVLEAAAVRAAAVLAAAALPPPPAVAPEPEAPR